MKRILLTTVALAALAGNAFAADIPARVTKAPAVVAPICNWCGFYVGLNAGYAWGQRDVSWGGVLAPFGTGGLDNDGFVGGGQIGFNWQFPNSPLVVGIEADIQGGDIGGSRAGTLTIAGLGVTTVNTDSDLDWFGTIRGRIGYAWANWMVYATGGWAFGNGGATATVTAPGFATSVSTSDTKNGWTVGGGVEGKFAPNWSAKLEYLYFQFDGGTAGIATPAGAASVTVSDLDVHIFRVGVNYHFATR
jgi:outer membrane immunogenic protein